MTTGKVKWFSNKKGYGFITPSDSEKDIFIHHSGITGEGYKSLYEGQDVEFEIIQGQKGDQAVNLTKKDGSPRERRPKRSEENSDVETREPAEEAPEENQPVEGNKAE